MTKPSPHTLIVRVTPKASRARVEETLAEDGTPLFKVYVTCPPEEGKANTTVIEALAKHLGLPKSHLSISHGHTSRNIAGCIIC
jgi:uncharacterized protein